MMAKLYVGDFQAQDRTHRAAERLGAPGRLRAAMPSIESSSLEMASVTCSSSSRVPVNMLVPRPRSLLPTWPKK